jgi:hypothetical protein
MRGEPGVEDEHGEEQCGAEGGDFDCTAGHKVRGALGGTGAGSCRVPLRPERANSAAHSQLQHSHAAGNCPERSAPPLSHTRSTKAGARRRRRPRTRPHRHTQRRPRANRRAQARRANTNPRAARPRPARRIAPPATDHHRARAEHIVALSRRRPFQLFSRSQFFSRGAARRARTSEQHCHATQQR